MTIKDAPNWRWVVGALISVMVFLLGTVSTAFGLLYAQQNERIDAAAARTAVVETRVGSVETTVGRIDERLKSIESGVRDLGTDIRQLLRQAQ